MKPSRYCTFVFSLLVFSLVNAQLSWYKNYNGSIDKYPITMHLHKSGHEYRGYYFYNSRQEPVYFLGDDTTEAGKIKLIVFLPDREKDENFIFSIAGSSASGEWRSTGQPKPLSFSAKEISLPLGFHYIYVRGVTKLRPKMEGSPEGSFEAASVWPKGNGAQQVFLKKLINENFGLKNATGDVGKLLLYRKDQFFEDYLEEYKDAKEDELKDAYSWNMEQSDWLMIVYHSTKLLTLANFNHSYTGGAHGNYGTSYTSIDLLNKKKLLLNHVLTAAGQKQLTRLLEKYFRKTYSVKSSDPLTEGGLFENKIEPNDNFYLTAKGIGFCYTPYEIGPFAMGEVNVFIPFTELNSYLQPAFRKIIQQ